MYRELNICSSCGINDNEKWYTHLIKLYNYPNYIWCTIPVI